MKILIFILVLSTSLFSQENKKTVVQNDTIYISPYSRIKLPQTPLIYFPVTSINFGLGNIKIKLLKDESGKPGGEAIGSSKEALSKIGVGEVIPFSEIKNRDPYVYNGCGYPAYILADFEFKKPGCIYQVSMIGSGGCGDCKQGDVSFPRPYMGKENFIVKVGYPTINLKQLREKYFYNEPESFDFKALEFQDESLYMHKILVNGKEVQTVKGYRVVLDPIFINLDYNDSDIEIACYYDNNLIKLSPTEEARRKTRFEADFSKTGYEPKDKWKNNPEDAVTISLSNPDNLLFNFFYVFGEGSQRKEIPPFEGSAPGGGIPTVTLNDDFGNGLEFVPVNNWKTIKLNPQDFEKIKPNSVVKLEFNFIDQKTKKAFNYKLFCIKK